MTVATQNSWPHVGDPAAFGKVAVMMGGTSAEREISLMTGSSVLIALRNRDVNAHVWDPAEKDLNELAEERFDRAWIALHGRGGEDGVMQGALECLALPYTGSGVLGCALSMDKIRTKQVIASCGFGTPSYAVVAKEDDFSAAVAGVELPLIVKPAREGSSVGMTKVETLGDLDAAVATALELDERVLVESWITGEEYTAGVLQGQTLPLIRIETPNTFYDYEAKYFSNETRYVCPSGLTASREQELAEIAMRVFAAVGADGWGRVDFILDDIGQPLFLEVNTVPGMTDHSLVPMAAKELGVGFDELVWRVLETSLTRNATMKSAS